MARVGKNAVRISRFDDPAEVHHRDLGGQMFDYG
jgi:hypothetical protein